LATYRKHYQVAIKMVDMDQFEQSQIDELRREIQIMSLCRHDNVLPVRRSFMHDSKLCIVTPVMTAGELTIRPITILSPVRYYVNPNLC
jgi:serine/threonine protein kinase